MLLSQMLRGESGEEDILLSGVVKPSIQELLHQMMLNAFLVWPVIHMARTLQQRTSSMGFGKYALNLGKDLIRIFHTSTIPQVTPDTMRAPCQILHRHKKSRNENIREHLDVNSLQHLPAEEWYYLFMGA